MCIERFEEELCGYDVKDAQRDDKDDTPLLTSAVQRTTL